MDSVFPVFMAMLFALPDTVLSFTTGLPLMFNMPCILPSLVVLKYTAPPLLPAVLFLIVPPDRLSVDVARNMYTAPPLRVALLPEISPPVIFRVDSS